MLLFLFTFISLVEKNIVVILSIYLLHKKLLCHKYNKYYLKIKKDSKKFFIIFSLNNNKFL